MSVKINTTKCKDLAQLIKRIPIPSDEEEPTDIIISKEYLADFYFSLVAICHQTTPITGNPLCGYIDGSIYKGWDYLREKWLRIAQSNQNKFNLTSILDLSEDTFIQIMKDDHGNLSLSNISERLNLLHDIILKLNTKGYFSIKELYRNSNGFLVSGDGSGLLQQLSDFIAYSDPVKKKSYFFLSLMKNHSIWNYKDEHHLGSPVDYHEIRGHLRLGTVTLSNFLGEKILNQQIINSEEDIFIRQAIHDAIKYISSITGYSSSTLHYFFWNIFRNCCNRNSPHCNNCDSCNLPTRYNRLKINLHIDKCIFEKVCDSANLNNKFIEPIVLTHYY